MEWWWLLIVVPLYNLWKALSEAWKLLLDASSDEHRREIMEDAGAKAFINTIAAIGIAAAPWPYKLIGLLPTFFPSLVNGIAMVLGVMFRGKYHRRF